MFIFIYIKILNVLKMLKNNTSNIMVINEISRTPYNQKK